MILYQRLAGQKNDILYMNRLPIKLERFRIYSGFPRCSKQNWIKYMKTNTCCECVIEIDDTSWFLYCLASKK